MGRIFTVDLEGMTYICKFCKTPLVYAHDLVSQAFQCRTGVAYLFNNVVNVTLGTPEEKVMLSGVHTVSDIFCCCCGQILGWKYEVAHDSTQKYKEGKFVLDRGMIFDAIDAEMYNNDSEGEMSTDDEEE